MTWTEISSVGELVHVIEERTIALAERPGNRRPDGYRDIPVDPHVCLTVLIPGRGDTLRVSGRARLVSHARFVDEMQVTGHRPLLAVVAAQVEPDGRTLDELDEYYGPAYEKMPYG